MYFKDTFRQILLKNTYYPWYQNSPYFVCGLLLWKQGNLNLHWYTCVFETWNVRLTNPFVRNISPCLYFWNTKNPSFPWELTSLPKGYFPQRKMFVGGWVTIYSEEQFLYTLFLLSHIIEPLYASCFLSHSTWKSLRPLQHAETLHSCPVQKTPQV